MTEVPTVTQVLGLFQDWSSVPSIALNEAAYRGSAVHRFVKNHLRGTFFPSIEPEFKGYCDSALRWIDRYIKTPLLIEERLECTKFGFSGGLDLVAIMVGDTKPAVIDWKTAVAVGGTWGGQLAAYAYLYRINRGGKPIKHLAVRPQKDGSIAKATSFTESGPRDFQAFLNALYAFKYWM